MGAPCIVCGKGGRRKLHGAPLCGECWRDWMRSGEARRAKERVGIWRAESLPPSSFNRRAFEDFVRRRQAEQRIDREGGTK